MPILRSDQEWAEYLHTHPEAHILQTPAWGKFKQSFGWHPAYVVCESCGAQVLFRKLPLGLSIGYIPKGPLGHSWEKLVPDLDRLCRKMHAIHLVIEPDLWELTPQADIFYHLEGFHFEEHTIQPRHPGQGITRPGYVLRIDASHRQKGWLFGASSFIL